MSRGAGQAESGFFCAPLFPKMNVKQCSCPPCLKIPPEFQAGFTVGIHKATAKEIPMARTFVLVLGFLLLIPVAAPGAIVTVGPSDCSDTAVNAAIAAANSGDVINLTCTGTASWANMVTIPSTKGLTIQGPGSNTPKTSASFPLIISFTNASAPAIQISCGVNMPLSRVTGLKFQGVAGTSGGTYSYIMVHGQGLGTTGIGAYRIDNCYFDTIQAEPVVLLNGDAGELTGLVDDCTFHDCNYDNYNIMVRETNAAGCLTGCYGCNSWTRPFNFGDAHFHFIEDCLFEQLTQYNRHMVSCDGSGGRYVVRYCTLNSQLAGTSPDYIDAHGDGTGGLGVGTRGGEIYSNTFMGTSTSVGRDIVLRGGQFLVYNNTFTTTGYIPTPVYLNEYRADVSGPDSGSCTELQNPSACNPGIPQCVDGSTNEFNTWYPLPGQIRGTYLWNNILGGVNQSPTIEPDSYVSQYIQANRDFWVSTSQPSALSGYTPYPYPHPLRQAVTISPPTGLHVIQ